MLEDGLEDMGSNAYTKLGELKSAFGTKKEEENLKLLKVAMDKFKEAVKTVFGLDDVPIDFDKVEKKVDLKKIDSENINDNIKIFFENLYISASNPKRGSIENMISDVSNSFDLEDLECKENQNSQHDRNIITAKDIR